MRDFEMNEQKWADRLEGEFHHSQPGGPLSETPDPGEDFRGRLELARRMAQADYSGESRVRDSLRTRLEDLSEMKPSRSTRLRRSLATGCRWAAAAAFLILFLWGMNWMIGSLRPLIGSPAAATRPAQELEGTQWILASLHGNPPLPGWEITIYFTAGQAKGSTGCNQYGGKFPPGGNESSQEVVHSVTVQKCEPPELMDQEKTYLDTLWSSASYRIEGGRLILLDAAGNPVLEFIKENPSVEPTAAPATPAPTEALPAGTATRAEPEGFYATQEAVRGTQIAARATASPFPTAAPAEVSHGQPSIALARRDGLSMEVRLPKDAYLYGEGGQALVTLTNDGSEPIFLNYGHDPAGLALMDEQGYQPDPWPFSFSMMRSGPPYLKELNPGESISDVLHFQVPPVEQNSTTTYALWAETRFCRADPLNPEGPDNLWMRLESGPIFLNIHPAEASQQLHAGWQVDRSGWRLTMTTADGAPLAVNAWGEFGAATENTMTAGLLGEGQNGVWSGGWSQDMVPEGAQAITSGWIAAEGYVTAVFSQTLAGSGNISSWQAMMKASNPKSSYRTLAGAQAAVDFPIYTLADTGTWALLSVQVQSSQDGTQGWTRVDQQTRPADNNSWLVFSQIVNKTEFESAGWGEARYDQEAVFTQVNGQPAYAIRHFGWWWLDWKEGSTGFELRGKEQAYSLDDLLRFAADLLKP